MLFVIILLVIAFIFISIFIVVKYLIIPSILAIVIIYITSIITSYISLKPSYFHLSLVWLSCANRFISNIRLKDPILASWLEKIVIFFIRHNLGLKIISSALIKSFIGLIYFISPIMGSLVSGWLLLIIVSLFFFFFIFPSGDLPEGSGRKRKKIFYLYFDIFIFFLGFSRFRGIGWII
uniref:Uncharacterized protein n=1 Tax=Ophiognomonia clavigignenti-juglandacearum TaxID=218668 RepID=A0A291LJI2_9PEZI|nr:hypothetical protein [Ophiognomonia clavigignenti-juglandacearum]